MDKKKFENIAAWLRERALRTARAAGSTTEEGEDIAQEVMLRLWQMLPDIGGGSHAEALAVLMARRLAVDLHRKSRTVPLEDHLSRITLTALSGHETIEAAELEQWLDRRLRLLPPTQHAVLRMRQVDCLDNAAIARRLGIAEASVSTLLSRARRTLLDEIKRRKER